MSGRLYSRRVAEGDNSTPWEDLTEQERVDWAEIVAARFASAIPSGFAELSWYLDGLDDLSGDAGPTERARRIARASRVLDLKGDSWRSLLNDFDRETIARVRAWT